MQTFLIIIGIWLLINVLFVVIMMPPRKPRRPDRPRSSAGLAPTAVEPNDYPFDEDEKISLRHTIIAIAMGALFSLTPPLLQAADDIKRLLGRCRKAKRSNTEGSEGSLDTVLDEHRVKEAQNSAHGSRSDERDEPKR